MTEPESKPEYATEAGDAELLLADPDEYHRRERLKELHKRRQQVSNVLDDLERYVDTDVHNLQRANLADAVCAYIAELEPLFKHTEITPTLHDSLPWDSVTEYADKMGAYTENGETKTAHYTYSFKVFRACNRYLAEVKPLIEEDNSDEWKV